MLAAAESAMQICSLPTANQRSLHAMRRTGLWWSKEALPRHPRPAEAAR